MVRDCRGMIERGLGGKFMLAGPQTDAPPGAAAAGSRKALTGRLRISFNGTPPSRTGLEPSRFSAPVFPISVATHLLCGGADLRVAQELLGHSDNLELHPKVVGPGFKLLLLAGLGPDSICPTKDIESVIFAF